jgi:hypothetical protein
MAHRIVAALTRVLRDPSDQTEVHFHQDATNPSACFDPRCDRPQMEIRPA